MLPAVSTPHRNQPRKPSVAQVTAAQTDGRWGAARHEELAHYQNHLFLPTRHRQPQSKSFYDSLNRANVATPMLFRLHNMAIPKLVGEMKRIHRHAPSAAKKRLIEVLSCSNANGLPSTARCQRCTLFHHERRHSSRRHLLALHPRCR